ncbi:MAG TPA: respiratory nitrate reductase subunit gamma [Solirubrobacter sp.]|nr:respiratory nitrate reductase subunit gamma [Solirubrobacter sp.]
MSRLDVLLWVAVPYVCIGVFVVGHVWRYRRDQFSWTTRSTQLLEQRRLRLGAVLFHLGLLAVIGGHVVGVLVPASVTEAVGIHEHLYHRVAVAAGTASGLMLTAGFFLLVARRVRVKRVRRRTTRTDVLLYVVLGIVVVTGMWATVGVNLLGGGYDYRETVAPWFRGLFLLSPATEEIAGAPLVYQVHALSTLALYAIWPFSRLVHAWSAPIGYLRRAPIVYRRRSVVATRRRRAGSPT